ncbi:carbohydrate kinase [Exilibacterium tricleocarpae]|uniref:Carbohydrate kinase n=1 Tax=Exilibacterium tricleocarpae TaxID=2591008 RepID=A0A545U6L0_9GAMM|nr:carbohydrate kinase [Exilibacterium tricleocarpae]TQV85108.1 carbohydrate kinase [Exilibacterium tricleocarpae]
MKPVLCFGEVLIDFLNVGQHREGPLALAEYRQYPGGAPANAAVAVAKLGGEARFAGQVGSDPFGEFLATALREYGVNTDYLHRHEWAKTPLAFVILDAHGDRSFAFHRHETADLLFQEQQIDERWFDGQPVFHICSNTLTEHAIAGVTRAALARAKAAGATVSFDVNLRHNLWPGHCVDRETVNACVFEADLLKFAREELAYLAAGDDEDYLKTCLHGGAQLILVTDGPKPVRYITGHSHGYIDAPPVTAVDTTAAGDAFSGALLYGLSCATGLAAITAESRYLNGLLNFAVQCSALTVTRPGAFPALPTFDEVEGHWIDMP